MVPELITCRFQFLSSQTLIAIYIASFFTSLIINKLAFFLPFEFYALELFLLLRTGINHSIMIFKLVTFEK